MSSGLSFRTGEQTMTKKEWSATMKELETLHRQGDWKIFYETINRISKIKQGSCLVKNIRTGDTITSTNEERDREIANHLRKLYDGAHHTQEALRG